MGESARIAKPVRSLAAAALIAALAIACAATAQAQNPSDPYLTVEEQAETSQLDTDLTPVAKDGDFFSLVHGAEFGETEVIEDSVTRFDTDLFTVSFRNKSLGLAGGSACAIEPVQGADEKDAEFGARVATCAQPGESPAPRVPALYRYDEPPDDDPGWDRLTLPGSPTPGYIGAIAWPTQDTALIVGGTGSYPRREGEPNDLDPTDPQKPDQAGKARAWLYHRATASTPERVEELDLSAYTPGTETRAGMRGFSAVGCYVDPTPGKRWADTTGNNFLEPDPDIELCFAGALGQLWEWRSGAFNGEHVDAQSPATELEPTSPDSFRFRVRDIAFYPEDPSANNRVPVPDAVAVTSGCCVADPQKSFPRRLSYNDTTGRWTSQAMYGAKELLPDSAYSLMLSTTPWSPGGQSIIVSPGGEEQPGERSSVIAPGETVQNVMRTPLSTARVVAGDGDAASADIRRPSGLPPLGNSLRLSSGNPEHHQPDGVPDWTVGELRSTRLPGLGAHGLLVATALPPRAQDALNEGRGTAAPDAEEVTQGEYQAVDQEKLDAHIRSRHYFLPSYSANAIDMLDADNDGWAVGDHGAIMRLSASFAAAAEGAAEPKPPHLGQPRPDRLSDRGAYQALGPGLPQNAGEVPPLGPETEQLPEPRLISYGSIRGGAVDVVMSRDGSEGWAIGDDRGIPTFTYYDGVRWSECDPLGAEGISKPDPACAAMAPLITNRDAGGNPKPLPIHLATRVPLENDSDPTNDDELEIVALGSPYKGPETKGKEISVFRFSDGRWDFGEAAYQEGFSSARSLVFTAPDDGWALGNANAICTAPAGSCGAPPAVHRLSHFDGSRWYDCQLQPGRCGNDGQVYDIRAQDPAGLALAGERVYLYGARQVGGTGSGSVDGLLRRLTPLILYKDPGGEWTDGAGGDEAGFDPGFSDPGTPEFGRVSALTVQERADGGYEGWAVGEFGRGGGVGGSTLPPPDAALLRLDPATGEGWYHFRSPGAFEDYMLAKALRKQPTTNPRLAVGYPSESAPDGAFIGQSWLGPDMGNRTFGFDSERQRFALIDSGQPQEGDYTLFGHSRPEGGMLLMAPDGQGGFWGVSGALVHYTDRAPKPVFSDAPDPLGTRGVELRDLEGAIDGSVWIATNSDRLYRYDRLSGWEEARIPGWDPGRVVTRASQASAIAIGPGGEGVVVGEGGRIANVSPDSVQLDPAAGRSCVIDPPPPCSTSRDLNAVDVAPDGSAIAAGNRMALLWRAPGGEFQSLLPRPAIGSSTAITHVSHPTPTRAYLATDAGVIFRGDLSAGAWRWTRDNVDANGEITTTTGEHFGELVVRDLAIDASGHGYAVGNGIYERTGDGEWRRIPDQPGGTAVALSPDGTNVLVGAGGGRILTGSGPHFAVAHHADISRATGPVAAIAYLPGSSEGSVDAWVGIGSEGPPEGDSRLLRHRSEPADPALAPGVGGQALADAPATSERELSIAAFGKSDCASAEWGLCTEMTATTNTNEVILERVIDELDALEDQGALDLAVMSGDATDSAGRAASSLADTDRPGLDGAPFFTTGPGFLWEGQLKHRRYSELVADELEDRGVPLFGAIGSQDLTETAACESNGRCETSKRFANAGENYAWREAFAGRASPWGDGVDSPGDAAAGEIEIVAAPGSEENSLRVEDQRVDPDGEGELPEAEAAIGGAATHYALDAIRDGEAIARIVFVDTSLGAMAANDPLQQPHELAGGQIRFLERMICRQGDITTTAIDECTREPDQKAIVVSNTPTYSYGPGALSHTAKDANVFEALMLRHRVDLVVSGALGYNGLYYTLAPGIHEPCPGGSYPEAPPSGQTPDCLAAASAPTDAATKNSPAQLPDAASLITEQGLAGAVPTLIASGAGGKFGPDGNLPADGGAGQWHGYSLARFLPSGDLVVEQRPILDWIGLDAPDHAVAPKSRLRLHGYGRSPLSTSSTTRALHYEIEGPAITHRYDLVLADPDEPWRACAESDPSCRALHANLSRGPGATGSQEPVAEESPCSPYLCLPSRIGTVDSQSGQVRAGDGKYPETYAIALLSVEDEVAAYPLTFKRSPSFVTSPALRTGALPKLSGARPAAPPPPPPPPGLPQIPQVEIPPIPPPPGIPQLTAAAPPELQPPAPPAPPPPSQQPAPLDLSVAPPGVSISTPTALIQPPTPPVNPAPPGGARREARQRQAAAQKGGAEGDASETQENGGDMAQGPPSSNSAASTRHTSNATRHSPSRAAPSFTTLADPDQPSAWSRGALYGGGLTLGALILAFSWATLRPTPRRRSPEEPAPAPARAPSWGHRR